jgi:hypothetical protein
LGFFLFGVQYGVHFYFDLFSSLTKSHKTKSALSFPDNLKETVDLVFDIFTSKAPFHQDR